MKVTFIDQQDKGNPRNGTVIDRAAQLIELFAALEYRPPFFCELRGENGFNLLVGIGGGTGCAQYSAADGSPPYLMAVAEENIGCDEYVEFLTADTPTPVHQTYCLPCNILEKVATDFVLTGNRSGAVRWQEV